MSGYSMCPALFHAGTEGELVRRVLDRCPAALPEATRRLAAAVAAPQAAAREACTTSLQLLIVERI